MQRYLENHYAPAAVGVTRAEVRATARAYHAEPELFSGMGHNMMLDADWMHVAERIHDWLESRDLNQA